MICMLLVVINIAAAAAVTEQWAVHPGVRTTRQRQTRVNYISSVAVSGVSLNQQMCYV